MHKIFQSILAVSVLSTLGAAQGASSVFSQFLGTTSVSAPDYGTATGTLDPTISSSYLTICTNYVHGLVGTANLASSAAQQLFQVQVDGVCQLCTSLSQSRVDSCCAQSTSSACFAHFGGGSGSGGQTATEPAHNSATATLSAGGSPSASAGATASGNGAGPVPAANNVLLAESILITLFGFVAMAL